MRLAFTAYPWPSSIWPAHVGKHLGIVTGRAAHPLDNPRLCLLPNYTQRQPQHPLTRATRSLVLHSTPSDDDNDDERVLPQYIPQYIEDEEEFLRREIAHLEQIEDMLDEFLDDEDNEGILWDADSLNELLGSMEDVDDDEDEVEDSQEVTLPTSNSTKHSGFASLEQALLQGVVPVSAKVGTDSLPGDFGFDPLHLATKDYFRTVQRFLLNLLPGQETEEQKRAATQPRPTALILRDYREAEIRHSRLAMLAAIFWPLQEMLDQWVLEPEQFGPLIYGPVTLPYFPLLMTLIMLLLGYLDIYSNAVKELDSIGEAYLPGDCFWDPLKMLEGAPDSMKRRMQERELLNGRAAMLAVVVFIWEEAMSHKAVIEIESNALLFRPIYQIPFIQRWLDDQFSLTAPDVAFLTPLDVVGAVSDLP